MVSFSVKAKWRSGWRRLKSEEQAAQEDAAFRAYWARIHAHLAGVDRPLPRVASSGSDDGGNPYRALLRTHGPFVMAPMVVMSERAFRILCRRHGVGLCFSPMVTEQRVLAGECPYTEEVLQSCAVDGPLVAQIAGADPPRVLAAAQRLASAGTICGVDLNLGCPQACARDAGFGVFLNQRDPDTAVAIVRLLAAELGLPVSAKIRIVGGVEKTVAFAKRLEEAGASMLTLHGRKPDQRDHQGPSDFDAIAAVREAVRIPVLVNGNCRTRRDAEAALAYTGADGVMSAVGLLRNPRLFAGPDEEPDPGQQSLAARRLTASGTLADPALAFLIAYEYLQLATEYPPPEFRCIRDHLQTLLQGLVQFELPAVWSLLGNEYVSELLQYRELLRLAASHFGVLEAMEAATGVDAAERARPVMPMAEIKRMYRLPDEEAEEECLAAFGSMFEAWGDEDDDDVDEAEAEGAADDTLASAGCANGGGGGCSSRLPAYALEVQVPWSRRLLDGTKTIETRAYLLPAEVLQQPVLLVESPAGGGLAAHGLGAGRAVGLVVFGASRRYATRDEWAADAPRHGVDPSASAEAFGWTEQEEKWGWEVARVEVWPDQELFPLREEQRLHRSVFRLA